MSFSSMGNDFHKNLPFHTQQIYTTTYHRAELLCLVAWSVLKIKASLITQVLTPTAQTIQEMSSLFPIPLPIFSKMPRLRSFNRSVLNWCRQLSLVSSHLATKQTRHQRTRHQGTISPPTYSPPSEVFTPPTTNKEISRGQWDVRLISLYSNFINVCCRKHVRNR